MARSLRCPRCSTVVEVADGQAPVCPSCGFGGPAQPSAPPVAPPFSAPQPGPSLQPLSPPPASWGQPQGRTDGMSVAALVLGCLGWLSLPGLVMSILAIVLGIQGMNRCKRDPALRGHGMALAGVVLGSIFLGIWLLVIIFVGSLIASFGGW